MSVFIVCQNKRDNRVALIPEVDEMKLYKSPIGGDHFYVN